MYFQNWVKLEYYDSHFHNMIKVLVVVLFVSCLLCYCIVAQQAANDSTMLHETAL